MFKKVNKLLSSFTDLGFTEVFDTGLNNSGKLDIAGVINDEFEYSNTTAGASDSNTQDLDKIIAKLTTLGITSTIKKNSAGTNYVDNTFVITSQPITTSTNTDWSACVKQFGGTMEASSDPTWVLIPLKSDKVGKSMWFKNDYKAMFRPGGGAQDIKGTWACTGNKLTIKLDDKWTWNGEWIDPKTAAVVDPKVAYQQRAKQVNQQTIDTTKQIQQSIGQEPTGNLDSIYIEKVIDLLKQ